MKKTAALMLALALLFCLPVACAEGAEEAEGVYALMTIPYDLFYAAETTGGQYDSVSSATRVKPLMMTCAGGSFHYMTDGREITGVIFPIYAETESLLAMYGGEEYTDESTVTVTIRDNGQVITETYTGRDALFQSYPFSYYRLSEIPPVFKTLNPDCSFGPMQGLVLEIPGTVRVVEDPYADVCVSVEGIDDTLSELNVNAVVVAAADGTRVGMKHLENIWLKSFSGFNSDSETYALLRGKELTAVEFYTFDAKFVVAAEEGVRID